MSAWDELDTWVRTVWGRCTGWLEVDFISVKLQLEDRRNPGRRARARPRPIHLPLDWDELDVTPLLQFAETEQVYLGCCTIDTVPESDFSRGGSQIRAEMPGLWLDVDIGELGHKPGGSQLPRFESVDAALKTIEKCRFPTPSAIVHSGGGIYPWWLFDKPIDIRDADRRKNAEKLSIRWHVHAENTANENGYRLDKLADLARFLRPPGVINWKEGQRRETRLLELNSNRYDPNELWLLTQHVDTSKVEKEPHEVDPSKFCLDEQNPTELSDCLRACEWKEILLGWEFRGYARGNPGDPDEAWAKPGQDASGSDSVSCGKQHLTVFSDDCPLPKRAGGLTKWSVFAELHFEGSLARAAQDLADAAMYGTGSEAWPASAVERARKVLGLDLNWIKERAGKEGREVVRVTKREIFTKTADGRMYSTVRNRDQR